MLLASAFVFAVGILGVIAGIDAAWARILPYLMWDHLAVIIVCGAAGYKLKRMVVTGVPKVGALFPVWLIAAGIIAVGAIVPDWAQMVRPSTVIAQGGPLMGNSGFSVSSRSGKYYARIKGEPEREITETQYDELQQRVFSVFARFWVGFGLVALFLWNLVIQRLRTSEIAVASIPTSPGAASTHGVTQVSTPLVTAIWCLVLLSTALQFVSPAYPMMCLAPFPPLLVIFMPFVVFGVGALFAKRSPFFSPWLAQMVDAKYGPRMFETFLQRLKPLLLFGVATLVTAAIAFVRCSAMGAATTRPTTVDMFFFSGGLAFCMMHFIMRYRKVPGV